ncbi:MAG: Gfo/Idh/MocA family oxidoreductase [Clostridia bacterium]|nr:Gfo/Idh/MocA family oxidoreductase [Clostridia bacterium]
MYKVAILGVENSHAVTFLEEYKEGNPYGIEVVGIYSCEEQAVKELSERFGVSVMEDYDSLAGTVDGVIITARHGDNHYKYAKPYIKYGIPMMIDKPITCNEKDAEDFMAELCENGVKVCGGSIVPLAEATGELSDVVENKTLGDVLGGNICCPVSLVNNYGDFYFYSQHLAESMLKIFGYNPISVYAVKRENGVSAIVKYPDFDVTAIFAEGGYKTYNAAVFAKNGSCVRVLDYSGKSFAKRFYDILRGVDDGDDYNLFIKPVYLINAVMRSYESGKWETI